MPKITETMSAKEKKDIESTISLRVRVKRGTKLANDVETYKKKHPQKLAKLIRELLEGYFKKNNY